MIFQKNIFTLLFLWMPIIVFAQKNIKLDDKTQYFMFEKGYLAIFEDKTSTLGFEKIRKQNFNSELHYDETHGFSDSRFWYRFQISNHSKQHWIFNIRATQIDEIELYEIDSLNRINKRIGGDLQPYSQRELKTLHFAYMLNIAKNERKTYYLSVKSKETLQHILFISAERNFRNTIEKYQYVGFFYFGMFCMMILYSLFLFFMIRDITYFFYCLYLFAFLFLQLSIVGFSTKFFWGDNIWFTNHAQTIFVGSSTIFAALFSYKFLNINQIYPRLRWVYFFLVGIGAIIVVVGLLIRNTQFNAFVSIISIFNILLHVIGGVIIYKKGYLPAKYYLASWGLLFTGVIVFALKNLSIIPLNDYSIFYMPFASLFEVVLLSLGLGHRLNVSQNEKNQAEKELLNQLLKNEQIRSRIARDLHDDLGSTLSSVRILSEFATNQTATNPEKIPSLLQKITNSTQKLQENLQDIVWTTQTKSNSFDELSIRIRQFGGEILEAKNIDFYLKIDEKLSDLPFEPNVQYDIFMIYKEAINNIVKYARAKIVKVDFYLKEKQIILMIQDDGIGFDSSQEKEGNGLKNMLNRAENLEGKLTIETSTMKGCKVLFQLDVPQ